MSKYKVLLLLAYLSVSCLETFGNLITSVWIWGFPPCRSFDCVEIKQQFSAVLTVGNNFLLLNQLNQL